MAVISQPVFSFYFFFAAIKKIMIAKVWSSGKPMKITVSATTIIPVELPEMPKILWKTLMMSRPMIKAEAGRNNWCLFLNAFAIQGMIAAAMAKKAISVLTMVEK